MMARARLTATGMPHMRAYVFAALLLVPAAAPAQGIVTPYRPPVIPAGSPGSVPPFPGLPVLPPGIGQLPGFWHVPVIWPGYWNQPQTVVVVAPAAAPAPAAPPTARASRDDAAIAAAQVPATLNIELPAPAEVWLDGVKVAGDPAAVHTLTSPPLRFGGEHTFRVTAKWTAGGTAYQAARTSTVRAGGTAKLTVVRGEPVK